MTQYYILSISGSCSMFLTSIFAQYLADAAPARIGANGDCHDQGAGAWQETRLIESIGDWLEPRRYTKPLLYSHSTDLALFKQYNPQARVVLVDFDQDDVELISYFRTVKMHTQTWSEQEYAKLAGPDWPAYSPTNIQDSELVLRELVDLQQPHTREWWHRTRGCPETDYVVHFKTILAGAVNQAVADIVGLPLRPSIQQFIDDYQETNERLRIQATSFRSA